MSEDFDPRALLRADIPELADIVLLPDSHPMLAQRLDIFDFDTDPRDPLLIRDLLVGAMHRFEGLGIAANQIGLNVRAFSMRLFGQSLVLFNPVITELSSETEYGEEGCLTFPDLWLKIARPESCRIIYNDSDGARQSLLLYGKDCRCALHETDHVNGIVMTSKVSKLRLEMAKKKANKKRS